MQLGSRRLRVQAMRNVDDLECMACPPKYRDMQSFHKYYSGEAVAPVLTLFSAPPSLPHAAPLGSGSQGCYASSSVPHAQPGAQGVPAFLHAWLAERFSTMASAHSVARPA